MVLNDCATAAVSWPSAALPARMSSPPLEDLPTGGSHPQAGTTGRHVHHGPGQGAGELLDGARLDLVGLLLHQVDDLQSLRLDDAAVGTPLLRRILEDHGSEHGSGTGQGHPTGQVPRIFSGRRQVGQLAPHVLDGRGKVLAGLDGIDQGLIDLGGADTLRLGLLQQPAVLDGAVSRCIRDDGVHTISLFRHQAMAGLPLRMATLACTLS